MKRRLAGWQGLNHNGRMLQSSSLLRPRRGSPAAGLAGRGLHRWWPIGVAWCVWLLAGFSVSYWALRWMGQDPATPVPVTLAAPSAVDSQAVARALGAQSTAPLAATVAVKAPSRYELAGVVAPAGVVTGSGVALIAVDGQRPVPYRVGAVLDGRWRVHAVERRGVVLHPLQGDASAGQTRLTLSSDQP